MIIGFRNRRPTVESLAGRKLGRVEFAPYATADAPDRWIKVVAETPSAHRIDNQVGFDMLCEVNSPRNSLDLPLAGKGVALLPTFMGDAQERLSQVGTPIAELAHDQWIVTHHDDRHLPEVRRAIVRLVKVMQSFSHDRKSR